MTNPNRTPAPGEAATLIENLRDAATEAMNAAADASRPMPGPGSRRREMEAAGELADAINAVEAALATQPAQGVQAAGDAKPFAWAYVPSPTWKEVVITMDEKRADEALGFGCDVSPLYLAAPTVAAPLTDAEKAAFAWLDRLNCPGYYADRIGPAVAYLKRHGIGAEKTA